MTLPSPTPRSKTATGHRFVLQTDSKRYLPIPQDPAPHNIFDVLTSRRSNRVLYPLSEARLGELLWHSARVIEMAPPSAGYPSRQRSAPSAGGLQSQNILVQTTPDSLLFYDPVAHSLGSIVDGTNISAQLYEHAMTVVMAREATILWLAGDEVLISHYYNDGESLLWRDSGCLSAVVGLVAEAMNVGTCILGISGEPHISGFFGGNLAGFGAVLAGERQS